MTEVDQTNAFKEAVASAALSLSNRQIFEIIARELELDKLIEISYCKGVSGPCLYVDNYRLAGPKPYGGAAVMKTWIVSQLDLLRCLK